jgi:tetratricopeptide (TPR) repeat protein
MKLALVFVCVLSSVSLAAPDGTKVDAQTQANADKLFVDAQAAYQQGKYREAIDLFKKAYDLVRDPVYLFNIAQGYRKIADCAPAHDYYVQYLEADPKASNKDKVEQWIFELRPCVDKAREREAAARAAEGQRQPSGVATGPVETEVDRGAPFRIAGIALAGVGMLGLVVGVTYGVKGNGIETDIDDRCTAPSSCLWDSPEIQALHDDGETANTRALIGYIGGGIAIAAGVGLYMFGRTRVETVTVMPTAGGAAVGASFRW